MNKKQKTQPEDDEEIDILICARTEDSSEVLKGSVWDKCRDCGASVWISLSGQKAMKQNKKLLPFCIECVYQKRKDIDGNTEIKTAPGAMEELRNYLAQRKKH